MFLSVSVRVVSTVRRAAVGVEDLAVDPAGRAGQEGDDLGDVVGLAQALQRRLGGDPVDQLLRLAVEEQRRSRSGRGRRR